MKEQLGRALPVEPDVAGSLTAPDSPGAETALEGVCDPEPAEAPPARGLTARYILVEDIDYLMRTGKSRQVLALRWIS